VTTVPIRKRARGRAGFTLLELVLAMAVLALLAGAALPVAQRAWQSAARRATQARLEALALATLEFCRDCGRPPGSALELAERPADTPGWLGPYLALDTRAADGAAGPRRALLDAWSRPIELRPEPEFACLSLGPDGLYGADDLRVDVDFTVVRRAVTLRELEEIDAAVAAFRAARPAEALPRDWPAALAALIDAGCLPPGERHERDGWLEPYLAVPGLSLGPPRFTARVLLEPERAAR